ncbi:hypothetical protein [Chitinophaga sancti]|nr:hypothetical protein [Chitinophaga sancti]
MYNPSQQASAMTKVADIPVSYYTGKPNVNFPFFTLKDGSLSVSMSLGYGSFGGIQVQQEATWVGLGWDLNIGGAITRSIAGKVDEASAFGYKFTASTLNMPLWSTSNPTAWLNTLDNCKKKQIADGYFDCSPDIYFVNFDGQSAKMFFDKNGTAYFSPYKKWKVEGNVTTGFTITNETGTRYIFTTMEYSDNDVSTSPGSDVPSVTGNTAWFLTQMISANRKDTIQFNYAATTFSNEGETPSVQQFDLLPGQSTGCSAPVTPPDQSYTITTTNLQSINSYILTSVVSAGGKMELVSTADRADINLGNKYRLREVNIYNAKGTNYTFLKKFRFYQSYSNNSAGQPLQRRMLLDSMVEVSGSDSLLHRFSYINKDDLPKKDSYDQDHWGFYNRKGNSTLIPAYNSGDGLILSGADRKPDSAATQIGLLNTITYPTGGTTSFDYEQNDYTFYRTQSVYSYTHLDSTVIDNTQSVNTNTLSTANGEVTNDVYVKSGVSYQSIVFSYLVTGKIYGDAQADVWVTNEAGTIVFAAGDTYGHSMTTVTSLPFGHTYTLHAKRTGTTERAVITMYYKDYSYITSPTVYSLKAGGCRIKRITQYDGINHTNDIIIRFKYMLNDSLSSGVLLDYPKYIDLSYTPYYCPDPGGLSGPIKGGDWSYQKRQSISNISLGRTQGSPIGYSKITVLKGENGENGFEENYYSLTGINDTGGDGFPYIPRNSKDDLRGLLLQNRQYNSVGKVVKATLNEYKFNNNPGDPNYRWIWAAKYGIRKSSNTSCSDNTPDWSFIGGMYQIFQYWPVVKSTTDTMFDVVNNTWLTTIKNFTYDTVNTQLSREDLIGSDSSIVSTLYTYPNNYTGTAVYDSMLARNMLANVIEKTTLRNSTQTSRERTNYGFQSSIIVPLTKDFILANAPLETRLNLYTYDSKGNLVEQGKTSDIHEVYLWGYNKQYPVARIVGSTYSVVSAIVTDAILQNPSSDLALRNELNKIRNALAGSMAQVTTYTYTPGIGVTSETSPAGRTTYYEYNGLGELKVIRDQNNQIIKIFDYQRQAPITQ